MPLRREDKEALVAEVNSVASNAYSAVAAEYRGLTVEQMTNYRRAAKEAGVWVKVIKNTLARRALTGTEFECMTEALTGPLVLAFSQEDPGSAARVTRDFAKEHELLAVHALSIGGELLPATDIARLADLPTLDQALAMLLGVMKAPVEKFVRTLVEPHTKLVRTLAAVRDHKQSA